MLDLPPPLLELDRVAFEVPGKYIVRNVSLSLYPAEIVCVVGGSGAGKSTLLRIAAGLRPPSAGQLLVRRPGGEITAFHSLPEHLQPAFRRRHFGFVAQNARDTLDMAQSAAANIAMPLFENGGRNFGRAFQSARHWFDALQLDESRMNERPEMFSGGMQQRLQIAKALVHRPDVLFLDEPTTGLDTSAQAKLLTLLLEIQCRTGVAMLLVTHDLRIARLLAHRIVVVHDGEIVEEAPPDRLVADPQHAAARDLMSAMI